MKKIIPVVAILFATAVFGSADYPLTAHVLGSEQGHRPSGAWACTYELAVNSLVYIAIHNGKNCDTAVSAGTDLPARIEKNKVKLLVNGKEMSLEVIGTHE